MIRKLMIGKDEWTIQYIPADPLEDRYGGMLEEKHLIVIHMDKDHEDPIKLFGTLCHEVLHARNKRLSEKAVVETEAAIMAIARSIFRGE